MTLGSYPATSLATARTRADEARSALEAGKDPRTALAAPDTLRAVCEAYLSRKADSLRTGNQRKATIERLIYPALGDRAVADIRRSDIVRMLEGIEDTRGAAMAAKTFATLRTIFNCRKAAATIGGRQSPVAFGRRRGRPGIVS
jgi:hypothetical protein